MARFTSARASDRPDMIMSQGLEQAGPQPGHTSLGQVKVKHRQSIQVQGPAGSVTSETQPCRGQTRIEPGPGHVRPGQSQAGQERVCPSRLSPDQNGPAEPGQWSRPDQVLGQVHTRPGPARSRKVQPKAGRACLGQHLGRPSRVWDPNQIWGRILGFAYARNLRRQIFF